MGCLLVVLIWLVLEAIYFGMVAGIVWLICWAFGVAFIGWKICFGIWLVISLLSMIFKSNVTVKK